MKIKFVICLLTLLSGSIMLQAQRIDSVRHDLSIGIETVFVLQNYSSLPFFVNYTFNRKLNFELGLGPVLSSESQSLSGEEIVENGGGIVYGEFDYFFNRKRVRPYIGVGYSFLWSNFETNYVIRSGQGSERFYQNMINDVNTTISRYYIPIGVRFYAIENRLYFEPSIKVQYVNKNVTHSNLTVEGMISNHNLEHIEDYKSAFTISDLYEDSTGEQNQGPVSLILSGKIGFTFYSFKK